MVLAAGMGSRYGGLKQLDGLGPNGETIMDYSIYDAYKAGFGKVVFVIRQLFEKEFKEAILSKYENVIPVEVVFQELSNLPDGYALDPNREKPWGTNHAVMMGKIPEGFEVPEGREKPWGTTHALLACQGVVNEPFAIINADDFYGRASYEVLAKKLTELAGQENHYCMVGYRLKNTLSESGAVARGVCESDDKGFLKTVTERTHIERKDGQIQYKEGEVWTVVPEEAPVSMNMWGFTPDYFKHSDAYFAEFLDNNKANLKAEYFIPYVIDKLIQGQVADVEVLDTPAKWFGVTYAEDRASVVAKIEDLVKSGVYPSHLWK